MGTWYIEQSGERFTVSYRDHSTGERKQCGVTHSNVPLTDVEAWVAQHLDPFDNIVWPNGEMTPVFGVGVA